MSVNTSKSTNIIFTLKKIKPPTVKLNDIILPMKESVKNLGLHFDRSMTWKTHIKIKKKELDIKLEQMYWLMGKKSRLSLDNKILLYKYILRPIWTYGCQLWGIAIHSNIEIIQRFQNKTLWTISEAPWYATNESIHEHTDIETVKFTINKYNTRYAARLEKHDNVYAI